ncbi:hypothetical protein RYX36_001184 [Vicia faba]
MSSNFEIPTSKYSSILGAKLDKLPNQDEAIELFQIWKKEHERVYSDLEVTAKKFGIFVTNLKYITESNAKRDSSHSVLLGLTNFADLSFMEFNETYMTMNTDTIDIANNEVVYDSTSSCCWAFACVGAIEGIVAIKKGKLISLSEQELLDCVPNAGCGGGSKSDGFKWVIGNKGVARQDDYPYTAKKDVCRCGQISNSENSDIDSYYLVDRTDKGLLAVVAKQPLSVSIYAKSPEFQLYTSGIFRGDDCPVDSLEVTHGMLIVGYDSIEGEDYWIVKNSYGEKWGMHGYMYIKRNTGKKYGVAAINAWAIDIVKNK